jgi:hypothetical protein
MQITANQPALNTERNASQLPREYDTASASTGLRSATETATEHKTSAANSYRAVNAGGLAGATGRDTQQVRDRTGSMWEQQKSSALLAMEKNIKSLQRRIEEDQHLQEDLRKAVAAAERERDEQIGLEQV